MSKRTLAIIIPVPSISHCFPLETLLLSVAVKDFMQFIFKNSYHIISFQLLWIYFGIVWTLKNRKQLVCSHKRSERDRRRSLEANDVLWYLEDVLPN